MNRIAAFLCLGVMALLAACGPPRWDTLPERTSADAPQYGGELNIGTVYVTMNALSWDPADWAWKSSHDTGLVREQLFAADLSHAVSRGGDQTFTLDAYILPRAIRGELAESWEWENPLTLAIRLRRGVMFPDKPGVMTARELDADDIVATFNYINGSPRKPSGFYDHIDRVEARDSHTVVFRFNSYNAEWDYRFGYGHYSSIIPREALSVDQRDWRNVTGTGPFSLDRYLNGSVQSYARNPSYWDTETIGGNAFSLPFVDRVTYRVIKDEATYITALRTGKLDILETIRWIMAKHLMESTPELQWSRRLNRGATMIALRTDRPPLDDVRVRRALNMAVDRTNMIELLHEGQAEMLAFPQHPEFGPYYQPLTEMPPSVQELFAYNPDKAKALLAEAGVPDGFALTVQVCVCNPEHMDMMPLIADYWAEIGVRVTIQPMEFAAFLSALTTGSHGDGRLMDTGHINPIAGLRRFESTNTWNVPRYSDPALDAKLRTLGTIRDDAERIALAREISIEVLDNSTYVWLPTPYVYGAWWPWVRNYGGELGAGAARPGPIYARIWIDHDLKKRMGFQ